MVKHRGGFESGSTTGLLFMLFIYFVCMFVIYAYFYVGKVKPGEYFYLRQFQMIGIITGIITFFIIAYNLLY